MVHSLDGFTTLTAAARKIRVTVQTLRMWVDRGRIRALRDDSGRRILVRDDIERIVRERKRARAPRAPVK